MAPQRRCDDIPRPGFWNGLKGFFSNGLVKTLLIAAVIGASSFISTSVINMPKDYVPKAEFSSLAQAHKEDIKLLDEKKQDKEEYLRAHSALKESVDAKFNLLIIQMQKNEKMTEKLYYMHLSKKKDD